MNQTFFFRLRKGFAALGFGVVIVEVRIFEVCVAEAPPIVTASVTIVF
jgi:hypothetical protein